MILRLPLQHHPSAEFPFRRSDLGTGCGARGGNRGQRTLNLIFVNHHFPVNLFFKPTRRPVGPFGTLPEVNHSKVERFHE